LLNSATKMGILFRNQAYDAQRILTVGTRVSFP
jgi:hypothetical protein